MQVPHPFRPFGPLWQQEIAKKAIYFLDIFFLFFYLPVPFGFLASELLSKG